MIDMVDKMSNGVAVTTLKHIKHNIEKAREKDDSIDVFGCDRKALDMAIEALEQQTCEDCISRAEAINEMSNAIKRVFVEHRDIAEKTMNKLPSVTPSYNSVKTELKPRTNLAETSQDTISREAVIRLVEQYPNIIGNRCSGLIADIKYLPSVTQQPKVGKWIKTYEPNDAEPFILWECSNCQNAELGKRSKYCPNCGSYNGGEKDDK